MKTYYISVTETLKRIVEVQAESSNEAIAKVEDACSAGIVELDCEDCIDHDIQDETEKIIYTYEVGGMPKFYEVK